MVAPGTPIPLTEAAPAEVPLGKPPLVQALIQIQFPPILSLSQDSGVAAFQDALRADYPFLSREVTNHIAMPAGNSNPQPSAAIASSSLWRLDDHSRGTGWRVTVATDHVTLSTGQYSSRSDFLDRTAAVVAAAKAGFNPAIALRIGVRYINRIEGASLDRLSEMVQPEFLGLVGSTDPRTAQLADALIHQITQAQFQANPGRLICRWGVLAAGETVDAGLIPPIDKTSWVLDLDMIDATEAPFDPAAIREHAARATDRIYLMFRKAVTDTFLKSCDGTP